MLGNSSNVPIMKMHKTTEIKTIAVLKLYNTEGIFKL